jgi:hypothetical protein
MAGEGLFGFLLGMIWYANSSTTQKLNQKAEELESYDPILKQRKNLVNSRKKDIERYNLHKIYNLLEGKTQEAFEESMVCFLLGMDLAASNMICLTLDVYLKENLVLKYGNDKSLKEQFELFFKDKLLQPTQLKLLHYLRDQRNIQAHEINRLEEIDLLGMFKVMKDLVEIFEAERIKALIE